MPHAQENCTLGNRAWSSPPKDRNRNRWREKNPYQTENAVMFPRWSIAEIMAIVAMAALDCLAIRLKGSNSTLRFLIVGGLPMQTVLLVGLLHMYRRRREKPSLFLVGFEVAGWMSLLIYASVCVRANESLTWHLSYSLMPLLNATGFRSYSMADYLWRYGIAMSYLTAPQFATALVAGWINQRWSKPLRFSAQG
jgi:hypothetical protein